MENELLLKTYIINDKSYFVILETDYNNSHYYVLSNELNDNDIIVANLINDHIVPINDQNILKKIMESIVDKY